MPEPKAPLPAPHAPHPPGNAELLRRMVAPGEEHHVEGEATAEACDALHAGAPLFSHRDTEANQ
ncbi:hypothetical protein [Streptomyces sp. NRRL S-1813]|uniref:hypothetical protein n=1 Tax=Streptomyces sp. NRRL S-1813 TaxID=1463888 RepID=UPI00131DED8B|nr:hypothetical protein [Streptomyces sp. NRRL S-1813]